MKKSFSERVAEAKAVMPSVSVEQADALRADPSVVFVDPRPNDAIASTTGIIPSARNVTLEDIEDGRLPPELENRDIRIVTSCQGGPMGAVAAHELAKRGFRNVSYLAGGTQGWRDAGLPTV